MEFRTDCEEWVGRKPCRSQLSQGLEDCGGCTRFRPAADRVESPARRPFSREVLESARSVGIIRHGGLGNVLRTDTISRGIRLVNPQARITWFTHSQGCDLLRYVPGITPMNTETVDPTVASGLDVVINFEAIDLVRPVVAASDCVAGFALNEYGKFVPASPHAMGLQALQVGDGLRKHANESMQRVLLDATGMEDIDTGYDRLAIPDRAFEQAESLLGGRSSVGLNIGTSQKGRLKRWPASYWVQLIHRINRQLPDVQPVVLSGPEDADIRAQFLRLFEVSGVRALVLPDTLEIGQFMAVISRLDWLVTNDTFALHAASALGTLQVATAGPMPAQELEVRPTDKLLNTPLPCAPCYYHCIQQIKGLCMHRIPVERVMNGLLDLIEGK